MFLSHVLLQHFRGIVRLEVDFEPSTTVLIGENAVGKTSLLEALAICLGHSDHGAEVRFSALDFHLGRKADKPPPIRVRMTFCEREPGEWDAHGALTTAFFKGEGGARRLVLEVRAERRDGDDVEASWRFLGADGGPLEPQPAPELLRTVRELSPFLLVRADRYFPRRPGPGEPEPPAAARRRGAELAIEREIGRVYQQLIASDGPPLPGEVRKGLKAVARLIGDNAERVFQHPEAPERALDELVERPVLLSIDSGPELEARLHGDAARSVAVLLLVGAMLEARGPATMSPDASMILAIEEPEVHLHPLMLAAIWSVIESLRAQKIVTTNSGELLAAARLGMLRRLVRRATRTDVYRLGDDTLSLDDMRKITYHLRLKRDDALFARAWLLVEGETEVWLLPELARLMGIDFASEGIRCVEFAQLGIEPIAKVANDLGIEWHLIADGDISGRMFAGAARRYLGKASSADRLTLLQQPDVEHLLWDRGYDYVYHSIARGRSYVTTTAGKKSRKNPTRVIEQAINNTSKPYLALMVVEQAGEQGSPGIPDVLRATIETTLRLARSAAPATPGREAAPVPDRG